MTLTNEQIFGTLVLPYLNHAVRMYEASYASSGDIDAAFAAPGYWDEASREEARAGVPVQQHRHNPDCHAHGCLHAAHQLLAGIKAATPRYSDFWGLGCDCFAF